MIKYKDLIRTIEIVAKYRPDGLDSNCNELLGEHDEIVFEIPKDITVDEIRELASMGWLLGCDDLYYEEEAEQWKNFGALTDDELTSLFDTYRSVYMYT